MKYIPDFIRVDFLRKAIALLFALLVWWKISMQIGTEEVIRNVPINIIENISTVPSEKKSTESVNLVVRTISQRRGAISPSDIKISINLPSKAPDCERLVEYDILRDANIKKPFGIKILSSDPEKVLVKIDRRTTKEIPVAARFTGRLSDDYAYGEVLIKPEKVSLSGPQSILKNIKQIYTEPIILDKTLDQSFEKNCALDSIPNIAITPENVFVSVEIYKKTREKTLAGLQVLCLTPFGLEKIPVKIFPTNVDVTISGAMTSVESIKSNEVIPFININDEKSKSDGLYKVECYLARPDIKVLSIYPNEIKVGSGNSEK